MENRDNETFHYTYSAREQEEIKAIRKKYSHPGETDKMERLRRLDAGVTKKATIVSLAVGIIGSLVLGSGMSLVMTDLGAIIGLRDHLVILLGLMIGIVGIALVCVAYPVYNRIVRKERQRIAPEILRLTDELMK